MVVSWRLREVELSGWDPFGVAFGVFAGGPAAGFKDAVLGSAGEGQVVDVGGGAGGVVGDMDAPMQRQGHRVIG